MKIEICEQMVQSWLQHYKQCEIVQTNWKVSPLRLRGISDADIADLEKFMKKFQDHLNEVLAGETKAALQAAVDQEVCSDDEESCATTKTSLKKLNIFKKSTTRQFIRQCEIDVIGCKLDGGITEQIYLVDTAFHKTGLGYHNAIATVVKKIVRALIVAVLVFGEDVQVTVAFVSPKCGDTLKADMEKVIAGLKTTLAFYKRYEKINIELYFNERFTTDIYEPLLKEINELNDDNDLFMRAMNLSQLAESHSTSASPVVVASEPAKKKVPVVSTSVGNDNKTVVFGILNDMISRNLIDSSMLVNLMDKTFTLRTFGISTYPLLVKKKDFASTGFSNRKYYSPDTIRINGEEYRVCSQWIPERITKLKDWYASL